MTVLLSPTQPAQATQDTQPAQAYQPTPSTSRTDTGLRMLVGFLVGALTIGAVACGIVVADNVSQPAPAPQHASSNVAPANHTVPLTPLTPANGSGSSSHTAPLAPITPAGGSGSGTAPVAPSTPAK